MRRPNQLPKVTLQESGKAGFSPGLSVRLETLATEQEHRRHGEWTPPLWGCSHSQSPTCQAGFRLGPPASPLPVTPSGKSKGAPWWLRLPPASSQGAVLWETWDPSLHPSLPTLPLGNPGNPAPPGKPSWLPHTGITHPLSAPRPGLGLIYCETMFSIVSTVLTMPLTVSLLERSQFRDNAVTTRAGLCAHIPKPTSHVRAQPQFSCLRLSLKIKGTAYPAQGLIRAIFLLLRTYYTEDFECLRAIVSFNYLRLRSPCSPTPTCNSPSTQQPDDTFQIEPRSRCSPA